MKSKIILLLALVMGIITTVLFFNYMKQFNSETVVNQNVVEVVAAKESIKENQVVTGKMLQVVKVSKESVHANAVTDLNEIDGLFATADIEAGEIILKHRVKSEKEENLFVSRKIADGYRAVSVGVNFVQSVSNLIEPEDEVDVVFSETIKENNIDKVVTQQLLSKIKVLAVGRKMTVSKEDEVYVEYTSVTLEVTPEDAITLVNASNRGNIQFTLHSKVSQETDTAK